MTARVAEVMLRSPIVLGGSATVGEVLGVLRSSHVHMVLLTRTGRVGEELLGTLVRDDLPATGPTAADPEPELALGHARLDGRTVRADRLADDVRRAMGASGQRRAAVVDEAGLLLGLLCLKHHGRGFCTDAGVASRRASRQTSAGPQPTSTNEPSATSHEANDPSRKYSVIS